MTSLSAREQRLIALLILLLLLAGVWLLAIAPLVDGFARRSADRVELMGTIQRNERLIASAPQLRRRLEAQRPEQARVTLVAASRDAAADLLRQRLQRSFESAGGSLGAVGDSDTSGNWIGVSAEGTMSLDELVQLLGELQNQPPHLVVTGLNVVADRAFQSGKLDVMTVKIDVAIPYSHAA